MHRTLILFFAALIFTLPPQAWAKKVYSPYVEKGAIEVETQIDLSVDADPVKHGSVKQQFELAAGISDWWSTGLYAVYTKPGNRSTYDYSATKWENIFLLPSLRDMPLAWGLYAEYIWAAPASQTADIMEGKLLFETRFATLRHTLNITAKQSLGSAAQTASLGYAWRSQYAWPDIEMAVEAYGNMGPMDVFLPASRQSHLIGPVFTLEPWDDVEIELGWLIDVNAGPSYGNLKMNLEIEL